MNSYQDNSSKWVNLKQGSPILLPAPVFMIRIDPVKNGIYRERSRLNWLFSLKILPWKIEVQQDPCVALIDHTGTDDRIFPIQLMDLLMFLKRAYSPCYAEVLLHK